MAKSTAPPDVAQFIAPLNMNGLQGRMLRVSSTKPNHKREMLLVYGHHAKLERWWGLVEILQEYGPVTMPDLPGFGGMESFHTIGQQPTIDNFADYLAAFIRLRYKKRRVTIIGISFGFVVATRMLQRYPEMANKVDLVVSIGGFMHRDDFLMKRRKFKFIRVLTKLLATRPVAFITRYCFLNDLVIRTVYPQLKSGEKRLSTLDAAAADELMKLEVMLWQINDVSTHWRTTYELLGLDNCQQRINVPVWHVASKNDHYFDAHITEQHMRVVFGDYRQTLIDTKVPTPSLTAIEQEMGTLLPSKLRRLLAKQP